MPDYKKMYITMMSETEKAMDFLIEAQRKCEEMYISSSDPEMKLLAYGREQPKT